MPVWKRRFTASDRDESVYVYLPFTVPEDVARIEVRYGFEENGSIIDLGLLDPDAGEFPSRTGFRGWSGSARRHVALSAMEATPGYIAGDLQPGTWHVLLGLARISAAGCDCEVEVTFAYGEPEKTLAATRQKKEARPTPESRWYAGDLQSHTQYSDARGSLADLVRAAGDRGLEFLAVTDHNTHGHHQAMRTAGTGGLLLIPGEEVTTYRGHANVWGVEGWVDFRAGGDRDMDILVEEVQARGGLFSINHPKATPDCLGCDWEYAVPRNADAFEAWQGPWPALNHESLARYDAELRAGRRLTLVGGSDRHQPGYPDTDPPALQVGSPTTWLYLDQLAVPDILQAIKAGRAFVSEGPAGPFLSLEAGGAGMGGMATTPAGGCIRAQALVRGAVGDELHWLTDRGVERVTLINSAEFRDHFDCPEGAMYVRAEVVARASLPELLRQLESYAPQLLEDARSRPWRRALSNPVYLPGAEDNT